MAEVPELNVISMESYSDTEEAFYEDYSCDTKTSVKHLDWTSCDSNVTSCRSGVKIGIRKPWKPVHSFRKAIMLVVIVEKLKGRKGLDKFSYFDDSDLLNHILVEEEIYFNDIEATCAAQPKFRYSNTTVHIIRDHRHKNLTLQQYEGDARLVALFLQGKNLEQEAKINVGTYISAPLVEKKRPVTLGIAGCNLYLCCAPADNMADTPVLSLTEVSNMQRKKSNDLLPYLFYKTQGPSKSTTFESVAFPEWYISTSQQEHQSVQMKAQSDQVSIRDFVMYPEKI